jgi:hypothetical protein
MAKRKTLLLLLAAFVLLAASGYVLLNRWTERRLFTAIQQTNGVKNAACQQLYVNPLTLDAYLSGVDITLSEGRGHLSAEAIRVTGFTPGESLPEHADLEVRGFRLLQSNLPIAAGAEWKTLAQQLEKGAFLRLSYQLDPDRKILNIADGVIDIPGGGRLSVSARLRNISLQQLVEDHSNPLVTALMAAAISIADLRVDYRDRGLVKTIVQMRAAALGLTAADFARQEEEALKAAFSAGKGSRLETCLAAWTRFLQNPGRLRISASADPPVAIGQFWLSRDKASFFDRLGLEVVTQ